MLCVLCVCAQVKLFNHWCPDGPSDELTVKFVIERLPDKAGDKEKGLRESHTWWIGDKKSTKDQVIAFAESMNIRGTTLTVVRFGRLAIVAP